MAQAPTLGWARLQGHGQRSWETQENNLSSRWASRPRTLWHCPPPKRSEGLWTRGQGAGCSLGQRLPSPGRGGGHPGRGNPRSSCRCAHSPVTWPPGGPFPHPRHIWDLGLDSAWAVSAHPWALPSRSVPDARTGHGQTLPRSQNTPVGDTKLQYPFPLLASSLKGPRSTGSRET